MTTSNAFGRTSITRSLSTPELLQQPRTSSRLQNSASSTGLSRLDSASTSVHEDLRHHTDRSINLQQLSPHAHHTGPDQFESITANLFDQLVLLGTPVLKLYTKIIKTYAGAGYAFGLVTQDAALKFAGPVDVDFTGTIRFKSDDIDEQCSLDITDSFSIPDNPGIELANANLGIAAGGFLLGEWLMLLSNHVDEQTRARFASRTIMRGIRKSWKADLSPPSNLREASGCHSSKLRCIKPLLALSMISGLLAYAGEGSLFAGIHTQYLRNGAPLSTYKGLDNMEVISNQTTPFEGLYEKTCDITVAPDEYDPQLTFDLSGTLNIPTSYTEGVEAYLMTKILLTFGIVAHILGTLTTLQASEKRLESSVIRTTKFYLSTLTDVSQFDREELKQLIENVIVKEHLLPPRIFKLAEPTIDKQIEDYIQKLEQDTISESQTVLASPTLVKFFHPLIDSLQNFKKLSLTPVDGVQALDNIADLMIMISFLMKTSTTGMKYISSGFNRLAVSSTSELNLKEEESIDIPEEIFPSDLNGNFNLDVTIPKSRTDNIFSSATPLIFFIGLGIKSCTKLLEIHHRRADLRRTIQKILTPLQNNPENIIHPYDIESGRFPGNESPSVTTVSRDQIVKHIIRELRLQGKTTRISHEGISLGRCMLVSGLQTRPPQVEINRCHYPRWQSELTDAFLKTVLDLGDKLGYLGVFLGVGAKLADEFSKDAAIRFVGDATVNIDINSQITINGFSLSEDFNHKEAFKLEDLIIPNPSEVTLIVSLVGFGLGAVLIPFTSLCNLLLEEAIVRNEIVRAFNNQASTST